MIVGYAIDSEKFKDYARVKSVRIDVYEYNRSMKLVRTDRSAKVSFEDKMEMQNISVSGIDIKSEMGGKFRITVTDIYDGKDYDSFAVSELMLYMKDYDAHKINISDVEYGADGSVPEMWIKQEPTGLVKICLLWKVKRYDLVLMQVLQLSQECPLFWVPKPMLVPKQLRFTQVGDSSRKNWLIQQSHNGFGFLL